MNSPYKKKHTQAHQHSRVKFNKDDTSKSTHVVKIELIKRGGAKAFYRFFLQRSAINHFFFTMILNCITLDLLTRVNCQEEDI